MKTKPSIKGCNKGFNPCKNVNFLNYTNAFIFWKTVILLAACTYLTFLLIAFLFLSFTINFFPLSCQSPSPKHHLVTPFSSVMFPTASSLLFNGPMVLEHGLHVAPSSRAGMWWWHCCVLFLSLFTNRRRPNWSMPALRSLNRACSLKRPKLTNFKES